MNFTRWYDQDEQLKMVMEALKKVDNDTKISVASDLIQMIIESKGSDTDNFLDVLHSKYVPVRNRWYDQDETLHSAIEMLKLVGEDERSKILKEILYSILYFADFDNSKKLGKENIK